jgi:membrane associated rhomboid family serine protease
VLRFEGMLEPTPLKTAPRYPVTVLTAALSIAATIAWWLGQKPERLLMDGRVWSEWQLWRSLTCTLLHVNVFHLGFNLYWFWIFGTVLERVYGHARVLLIVLLLASGSSLFDFALTHGGVGLSGVVYGLWGTVWVLERHDDRFEKAVDAKTTQLFVGWFFMCIGLTVVDVMPVANVAHAVGAGLGALLGWVVVHRGIVRWSYAAALFIAMAAGTLGSTVGWPWVNLTDAAQLAVERFAEMALDQGKSHRAVELLEKAVRMRRASARPWYNLGVAYYRLNRYNDAVRAFESAARFPDATDDMKKTVIEMRAFIRYMADTDGIPAKD